MNRKNSVKREREIENEKKKERKRSVSVSDSKRELERLCVIVRERERLSYCSPSLVSAVASSLASLIPEPFSLSRAAAASYSGSSD